MAWAVFYVSLMTGALFLLYSIGQTLVSRTIPAGNIKLSVTKQHYKMGEAVQFTIKNNFTSQVYVNNACPEEPLLVYKWDGRQWTGVHKTIAKSLCKDQKRQIVIAAHESTEGSYVLWQELFNTPGLYRIVAVVNNYNGLPFADFEVMKPPPTAEPATETIINNNTTPSIPSTPSSTTKTQSEPTEREVKSGDN